MPVFLPEAWPIGDLDLLDDLGFGGEFLGDLDLWRGLSGLNLRCRNSVDCLGILPFSTDLDLLYFPSVNPDL